MDKWVIIAVNAEPWAVGPLGVKRNPGGKVIPYMGRNQQLDYYKKAVDAEVRQALGIGPKDTYYDLWVVKLTIYIWRQRAEYESSQARSARNQEADATNMLKSTEDALQGIFYKNDKDNRDVRSYIVEQDVGTEPRIVIHIEEYDADAWMKEMPRSILDQIIPNENQLTLDQA